MKKMNGAQEFGVHSLQRILRYAWGKGDAQANYGHLVSLAFLGGGRVP